MKNTSNIYDIDGELIRSVDDTHKWTVEEAQKAIEKYRQKLQKLDDKDPKYAVYSTYIRNLTTYVLSLYSKMSKAEMQAEIGRQTKNQNLQEQVNKAIEELKNDVENDGTTEDSTEQEIPEQSTTDNEGDTNEKPGNDEVIERDECNIHEERTVSQSDLLVEREGVTTVMDEVIEVDE